MKKNNKKTEKTFNIILDLSQCTTVEDIENAIHNDLVNRGIIKEAAKEAVKEVEHDSMYKKVVKSIKKFFHLK